MFSAAKYTVFSIVLCINITQSSDRSGFFLWFYAWKKRGNVDRTFLRSINGYLLWGDSGILYSLYLLIGYVNGMFRKVFYPDDIKLPMILILGSDFVLNLAIYLLRFLPRKKIHFGYYLFHIMIPEMVYTLVITIALYFIILKINRHLETIEKRSAAKFV